MPDLMDRLAALRPAERARLSRFASAFDRVDARLYPAFTEVVPPAAVETAQRHAVEHISGRARHEAVRAAVDAFVEASTQAYARRMTLTDTLLLFQSLPDRAEDRVRFLATVERAVVGLILWDELDPKDLAALLGPWASVIDRLGIPPSPAGSGGSTGSTG